MTHSEILQVKRRLWVILYEEIAENLDGKPDTATLDLLESLHTYILDFDRKIVGREVTAQYVLQLRKAISQASRSMEHVREQFGPSIDGYVYGSEPKNNAQKVWAACMQITTDLTKVVCGYEWQNNTPETIN